MSNQGILIVDDDGRRRESIVNKFKFLLKDSIPGLGIHAHDSQRWIGEPSVENIFIVLVHWKNRGVLDGELKSVLGVSTRLVPYSGGGLRIDEIEKDQIFSSLAKICFVSPIWDSVRAGESLHEQIWAKLVHYAVKRLPEVPDFLQVRAVLEYSSAISILCQGYLAQYALINKENGGVNINGFRDVGKALHVMGWAKDESAKTVSQAVNKLELDSEQPLKDSKFWTDPFEGGKSIRNGIQSELSKSHARIPDGIEALVKAIEDKNFADTNFVGVVAKAYLDLNQLLGAQGC
jgi:hypothetical protein